MRRAILILAVLLAGCERGTEPGPAAAARRVGELLYARNLIADTAVSAKMREFAGAVDGRGVPADSVLAEVHAWLEWWAAAHPERAARALLMRRASAPASRAR